MELCVYVQIQILIKIYTFELGVIMRLSRLRGLWYKSYDSFLLLWFGHKTQTQTPKTSPETPPGPRGDTIYDNHNHPNTNHDEADHEEWQWGQRRSISSLGQLAQSSNPRFLIYNELSQRAPLSAGEISTIVWRWRRWSSRRRAAAAAAKRLIFTSSSHAPLFWARTSKFC